MIYECDKKYKHYLSVLIFRFFPYKLKLLNTPFNISFLTIFYLLEAIIAILTQ